MGAVRTRHRSPRSPVRQRGGVAGCDPHIFDPQGSWLRFGDGRGSRRSRRASCGMLPHTEAIVSAVAWWTTVRLFLDALKFVLPWFPIAVAPGGRESVSAEAAGTLPRSARQTQACRRCDPYDACDPLPSD